MKHYVLLRLKVYLANTNPQHLINAQIKRLGSSCDWSRERFTMDEGCSRAVREVFVNLYEKGLIYQGERIINWCPHCKTSISDAEVEFEEQAGHSGTSSTRSPMAAAIWK